MFNALSHQRSSMTSYEPSDRSTEPERKKQRDRQRERERERERETDGQRGTTTSCLCEFQSVFERLCGGTDCT